MLPKPLEKLINEFSKLPGIGPKTANRLAFYLIKQPKEDILSFSDTLEDLTHNLVFCSRCGNIADSELCKICLSEKRIKGLLAVVEESLDIIALEKAGFKGYYHVLGGAISPVDGITPDKLRINELTPRINEENITEIVLATNPTLEGEATAMFVSQQVDSASASGKINLKPKLTRIARGLPMGGDLEYIDEITLEKALEGRREF